MQTIYDAKILIVDDNQDLLNLVTTALRSTGYNQLTACTGCAAAQAAFAANRPAPAPPVHPGGAVFAPGSGGFL